MMRDLIEYVQSSTTVYRKGDVVKVTEFSVSIDAFPEQPATSLTVDCHFVTVGFTEVAPSWSHQQFYDAIVACPDGAFTTMTADDFAGGPSYITIGGWIGDQTLAFQFMALGQLHRLWEVVTPGRLGITGPDADRMAGSGFVMTSGFIAPALADHQGAPT